jgi:DegV family protein with EDD domain
MSAVAICTDSSALFPAGLAERLGVTVVPIAITLDGVPFEERDDAIDDFYAHLTAGARVTTSQPGPGAFLAAYTEAATSGASEVLSIHLDARASGTCGSAQLAAREAPIPVTVVDTRTVSFGVGVCVRAAVEAIAAEASNAADAVAAVGRVAATLRNVFVAHTGLRGRLPEASGWSLLEFADGKVEPGAACDALSEAIEAMAARLFEEERPLRVGVGHAAGSTEPAADALALSLASISHVVDVERYRVGAAVGAHTGALSFGAFWWPAP